MGRFSEGPMGHDSNNFTGANCHCKQNLPTLHSFYECIPMFLKATTLGGLAVQVRTARPVYFTRTNIDTCL